MANPLSIKYTILDFPYIFEKLYWLNSNKKYTRNAITNLIKIQQKITKRRQKEVRNYSTFVNNLQAYMDTRIDSRLPAIGVKGVINTIEVICTFISTEDKNTRHSTKYTMQRLNQVLNTYASEDHTFVSLGVDKTKQFNIVSESSNLNVKKIDTLKGLREYLIYQYMCRNVSIDNWINISTTNIFISDNLDEEERKVQKLMEKYFISSPEIPTIYGGFSLSRWIQINGFNDELDLEYEYVKTTVTITLSDELVAPFPPSIFKGLGNRITADVVLYKEAVKALSTGTLRDVFHHIIQIFDTKGRRSKLVDLGIALGLASAQIEVGQFFKWEDSTIAGLTDRLTNLLNDSTSIYIVGQKASGKNNVVANVLPPGFLPINSDTKGQFIQYINDKPSLLKQIHDRDYTNPELLDALLYVLENEDTLDSIYEIKAEEFVNKYSITEEFILKGRMTTKYLDAFRKEYVEVSKDMDKGAAYGTICGALPQYLNKDINKIKKYKIINPDTKEIKKLMTFAHSGNEVYYAMGNAIIGVDINITNIPILLRRARKTSPVSQLFLNEYYNYTDTFVTTRVTLHNLYSAMLRIRDGYGILQ